MEDHQDRPDPKKEFNNASGWRFYGVVSSVTAGICIGVICLAVAVKADASNWWTAGAIFGFLGAAGGAYETYRLIREDMKANQNPPPDHKEPKP